jgi:glycosyltransferase involved in cell wall biosynthesis
MRWRGFHDAEYRGRIYGQKDREFPRYLDLPTLSGQRLRIAHLGADAGLLSSHGWEVVNGEIPSKTPWTFREFVQASRGEFGIAKHGYVQFREGWFSDRSVCYLASGRPVVLEDTGLESFLPVGEGVVVFRDVNEAVLGLRAINEEYELHRQAARRLAEDYFSTERVIPRLLELASQ